MSTGGSGKRKVETPTTEQQQKKDQQAQVTTANVETPSGPQPAKSQTGTPIVIINPSFEEKSKAATPMATTPVKVGTPVKARTPTRTPISAEEQAEKDRHKAETVQTIAERLVHQEASSLAQTRKRG